MATQLVFLTLFLGLISGPQRIDLQPGLDVKSIRILLDGKQVAALEKAPWSTTVDFGPSIAPGDLVAIGYDARGDEVARTSQTVNLPRPFADLVISVKNDAKGVPVSVELRWEHLQGAKPVKALLKVDGKTVALDADFRARLPRLDVNQPHVLSASVQFEDGFVPRRELVIGGGVGDTADALLTPVAVRQSGEIPPSNPSNCFTSGTSPVRVSAVEKGNAVVIAVVDPDPRDAEKVLDLRLSPALTLGPGLVDVRSLFLLPKGIWLQLLWPIPLRYKTTTNASAVMFPPSTYVQATDGGFMWLLTRGYTAHFDKETPRMFADAAGVAGLDSITGGNRRAVIVVLDHQSDSSSHDPASIRGYLSSIGVPLYVWSVTGQRPELEAAWGEIQDISSPDKLKVATDRLRIDLESQRVAWLATDGLSALRVQTTGRCNLTPLARPPVTIR
jgi:hypothetical protein